MSAKTGGYSAIIMGGGMWSVTQGGRGLESMELRLHARGIMQNNLNQIMASAASCAISAMGRAAACVLS